MPSVSRLKVPVSERCTVPCGQSGHSPSKPSRLAMQREGGVKRHYYGLYGSAGEEREAGIRSLYGVAVVCANTQRKETQVMVCRGRQRR
ncbi:hypothetical protein V8C40DRAFT_246914 [Trichoderma camerunense]